MSIFVPYREDLLLVLRTVVVAVVMLIFAVSASAQNQSPTQHRLKQVITYTFCGSLKPCKRGNDAIKVADCESSGKPHHIWPWARNGQYLGFFQMGEFARDYVKKKGVPWRWGIWQQARSASKLQRDLGWSQWDCAYIEDVL